MSLFKRPLLFCAGLLLLLSHGAALAAVEIAFYSREFGTDFPHAFVVMKGTLDRTGEPVDVSYGFTAKSLTPAILMGSVSGEVIREKPKLAAGSDRQFAVVLSDEQYDSVMSVVEEWRNAPQPSYNLNRRNCVHFAGELAQAAGLKVNFPAKLMKKPRSFLVSVREANADFLRERAVAAKSQLGNSVASQEHISR